MLTSHDRPRGAASTCTSQYDMLHEAYISIIIILPKWIKYWSWVSRKLFSLVYWHCKIMLSTDKICKVYIIIYSIVNWLRYSPHELCLIRKICMHLPYCSALTDYTHAQENYCVCPCMCHVTFKPVVFYLHVSSVNKSSWEPDSVSGHIVHILLPGKQLQWRGLDTQWIPCPQEQCNDWDRETGDCTCGQ